MTNSMGSFGIWRSERDLSPELATEIDRLGFGSIWVGGSSPGGELRLVEAMLDSTTNVVVATGIANIWTSSPTTLAASYHRIAARHPGRFMLGIGTGHPEATSDYEHPYEAIVGFLDGLDAEGVPVEDLALAALGPRVLRLARDRTAAAHPYLTPPAHSRIAREILGPNTLLAPEQKVVLDTDPRRARELGRATVDNPYLHLVNYTNNLRRLGYTEEDLANGGSDRLIDDVVVHGEDAFVAQGIRAHLNAGADHVAIQLLTRDGENVVEGYARLAAALGV
ncbi:MAG: class F420-dependent oxidoreductase [Pseudonocardiales bacterium]|nr:class F420-dependent oxidoreductase [Pseudonocardiales bacterium]